MDQKEIIEKKLAKAKIDLEKERVEMRKIQNQGSVLHKQSEALKEKFGEHAVEGKKQESKIEAYEELLKE